MADNTFPEPEIHEISGYDVGKHLDSFSQNDPYAALKNYSSNIPPPQSDQDVSTHWQGQSGMPIDNQTMMQDPNLSMPMRIGAAAMYKASNIPSDLYNTAGSAINSAKIFGDVAQGKTNMFATDPETGSTIPNPNVVKKSANDALLLASPSLTGMPEANTLGIFAGAKSATADLQALKNAKDLEQAGADRNTILKQTGWFKGAVDGLWRYEIPDKPMRIDPWVEDSIRAGENVTGRVNTIINHPDLFKAYPEAGDVNFRINQLSNDWGAQFDPNKNRISITPKSSITNSDYGIRPMFLHELQHKIQDVEGFDPGGSPNDFLPPGSGDWEHQPEDVQDSAYDQYHRTYGETEARNVEERRNLRPGVLTTKPPWETQDVPNEQQIPSPNSNAPKQINAGPRSQTADLEALKQAQDLDAKGVSRDAIIDSTGWFKGADGNWRYEISDDNMRMNPDFRQRLQDNPDKSYSTPVRNAFFHPELFDAYPDIGRLNVQVNPLKEGYFRDDGTYVPPYHNGYYTTHSTLNPGSKLDQISVTPNHYGNSEGGAVNIAAHELQHAIQEIEGWTPGSNSKMFTNQFMGPSAYEQYQSTSGEVEARNTQNRINMSPNERILTPPWDTQDVPYDKQIVLPPYSRNTTTNIPFASQESSSSPLSPLNHAKNINDIMDNHPKILDLENQRQATLSEINKAGQLSNSYEKAAGGDQIPFMSEDEKIGHRKLTDIANQSSDIKQKIAAEHIQNILPPGYRAIRENSTRSYSPKWEDMIGFKEKSPAISVVNRDGYVVGSMNAHSLPHDMNQDWFGNLLKTGQSDTVMNRVMNDVIKGANQRTGVTDLNFERQRGELTDLAKQFEDMTRSNPEGQVIPFNKK